MTSASGAILANADETGAAGVREVMMMFAVDVGERCSVRGCVCSVCPDDGLSNAGFGRARICERRFSSRKVA